MCILKIIICIVSALISVYMRAKENRIERARPNSGLVDWME